ncbi:TIGR03619 family F420-dependent LLM class oxidoreductase [Amycolatopsis sp. FDAARGOS 1241]|uniref:TIGR03619 family F420-dependent LLM class oxidoreductase n=1 Tax=Amycolatopsis sp. FDAARGOS 1241 TaxID=2778070 RepID=UPI00194FA146|nr:TIGR03619 family F420-dependent LLM class oxidoreductase [Amycolatopsis sp. FDAARGOS 1241]QRP42830.1 TIGR03619 family F420-dependent LLM class oxidoreductase [Amycolatopsis sp. FDAARGOS 1241]
MEASFGVKLPGLVPSYAGSLREIPDLAVEFEKLGFDDVMDGEHILYAAEMSHPGGAGNFEHSRTEQHSDRSDTLVMFGAIAAKTMRIGMISGILLAAAHPPAVLARQASTLDVLSGGRFTLGVGGGWNAAEFEQMGIPAEERAARTEEAVRACRELWSPGLSSFAGRWTRFDDVICEPAPVTPGGVPVWWGGNARSKPTARRVATLAQGWLAREAADDAEISASVDVIRAACAEHGRDPATVGIRASLTRTSDWNAAGSFDDLAERAITRAKRLVALGVTHFTVPLGYYGIDLDALGTLLKVLRDA